MNGDLIVAFLRDTHGQRFTMRKYETWTYGYAVGRCRETKKAQDRLDAIRRNEPLQIGGETVSGHDYRIVYDCPGHKSFSVSDGSYTNHRALIGGYWRVNGLCEFLATSSAGDSFTLPDGRIVTQLPPIDIGMQER